MLFGLVLDLDLDLDVGLGLDIGLGLFLDIGLAVGSWLGFFASRIDLRLLACFFVLARCDVVTLWAMLSLSDCKTSLVVVSASLHSSASWHPSLSSSISNANPSLSSSSPITSP